MFLPRKKFTRVAAKRTLRFLAGANRRGDGFHDALGLCNQRKLDQPDTVPEFINDLRPGFQCEACLARAADAHQCQQARVLERAFDISKLLLAPHEAGRLHGKIVRQSLHAPRWREGLCEIRNHRLIQMLRTIEIAQAMTAE